MSNVISKEDLAKLTSSEPREVEILGLGTIKIKPLTLKIRMDARAVALISDDGDIDMQKFQAWVIKECMVEPKLELGDTALIEGIPTGFMDKILNAIYKLSGVDVAEKLKKK